tara:strand:+ start:178 stop:333 length:156 start_codon:yes stop_codon:yes gene_type:complete
MQKKDKRIFLPKKCIVFQEKYVLFGMGDRGGIELLLALSIFMKKNKKQKLF